VVNALLHDASLYLTRTGSNALAADHLRLSVSCHVCLSVSVGRMLHEGLGQRLSGSFGLRLSVS
jgi:hypothetical protein